ncbi:ComEC/Rec2 family competence protein [Constantimarinum furrinae]|uniref:Competence protein ComEC n=1 Tax=Constantimarinum furrinae TaxID=2562285 RepID=A0A7G8PRY1_9FLAO|nr:ComEC/Rec2 family competence protein [Constantimarinum furrinae]QNJ97097.1 competence protein ComEC [Constantimarinum furrinae]
MNFINFAVVKFSICLALGIITAQAFGVNSLLIPVILVFCLLLLITAWFYSRRQLLQNAFFGSITFCCFFLIGYCNYQFRSPLAQTNHYSVFIDTSQTELLQLKITDVLKSDNYYHKYIADIYRVDSIPAEGKILLSVKKDSVEGLFAIDNELLISSGIKPFTPALNPHQFDYAAYMNSLGVLFQLQIDHRAIIQFSNGEKSVRGVADGIRNYFLKKLKASSISSEERSIIQALLLGHKTEISKELYSNYAKAGAVHILAVSGLHVGILFLIFSWLLRPVLYVRHGKIIKAGMIILLLFSFALLAGWSPSVVRAATMFSLFAFAGIIKRPTNSINTLFLSFFILLLCKPQRLFHIGFQLSYLAVFFILWVQPRLYEVYSPKNYFLRKAWAISTVSIAAQLGVLPLTLYYFHQFPGLFLLTNLVILPFLALLLGVGLLILLLLSLNSLPTEIAEAYNVMILSLNSFIEWVAGKEFFLIGDIHFSELKVISVYLVIIGIVLLLKRFSFERCMLCMVSLIFLVAVLVHTNLSGETQLILFHKSRSTIMGIQQRRALVVYSEEPLKNIKQLGLIKDYRIGKGIRNYSEAPLPQILQYKSQLILFVDSTGVYPPASNIDIIILRESPKINMDRLIDSLQPRQIVADGSNYLGLVKRWKQTCKIRKLPFHHTGEKGAFILE